MQTEALRTRPTLLLSLFTLAVSICVYPAAPARAGSHHSMQKALCLSDGGLEPGYPPNKDPNSPDSFDNDCIIADLGPKYVRLFVPWHHMQPGKPDSPWSSHPPITRDESWSQLNAYPRLPELDGRVVQSTRGAEPSVILVIYHQFPEWVNGNCGAPPQGLTRLPCDLEGSATSYAKSYKGTGPYSASPWGWFVQWLMKRYNPGGPANPSHARIAGIEIVNEPNLTMWPRTPTPVFGRKITFMIAAAMDVAQGERFAGAIYGPATSDQKSYQKFSEDVLASLNMVPKFYRDPDKKKKPIRLRWSHHNYHDVDNTYGKPSSVRKVLKLLACASRRTEADLYLTETGALLTSLDFGGDEFKQRDRLEQNWNVTKKAKSELGKKCASKPYATRSRMRESRVSLWTQYQINSTCRPVLSSSGNVNDKVNRTGLFDSFIFGDDLHSKCLCPGSWPQSACTTLSGTCPEKVFLACNSCVCATGRPAGRGRQLASYGWFHDKVPVVWTKRANCPAPASFSGSCAGPPPCP